LGGEDQEERRRVGDGREREELQRLRRKNVELSKENTQLAMERDVLKRYMVLWVK
jgi:hypothetical protein